MIRWGYAGHPAALWLDTGEELHGAATLPLGISADLACATGTRPLYPGAGVLLYTDGVTEARHDGELFGPRRLADMLHSLEGCAPSRIVDALTAEIHEFTTSELHDDLCMLVARVGE